MTKHNLNDLNQHAFHPKYSTETILNMLTDSILKPLDNGLITQLLLLDLSIAFHTISHVILFTRLNDVGMVSDTDNVFEFIKSYITKRSYSVLIGNEISICACSTHVVPQGSVIGPFFFPYILTFVSILSIF